MKSEWSSWLEISPNKDQIDSNAIESLFGANQKLQSIRDVPNAIGCAYELDEIVGQLVEITSHSLSATGLAIFLFDRDNQELSGLTCNLKFGGERQIRTSKGSKAADWVISQSRPLIVNDAINNPLWDSEIYRDSFIPVRSIMCAPLVSHSGIIGAIEVFDKLNGDGFTEHDLEILIPIANTGAIALENSRTHKSMVEDVKNTIKALAAAIDARDPYTRDHSQGVVQYSLMCGRSLSLSRSRLEVIEYAGILHDVGKIGISDAILTKPGPLTDQEYAAIRKHPIISANIISGIPFLEPVRDIVLHHHERYNGSGYPEGLTGEDIPLGSRILAVADALDAMTTDRPYRARMPQDRAVIELRKYSGKQFCPLAVDAFLFALETEQGLSEWRPRS
jgi:HD-GYP domain-containing protein (c-di-GMP phosphodiesterase class II)